MTEPENPSDLSKLLSELSSAAGQFEPLPGNPRRQAVASISGMVYQVWCSIDAWLRLSGPDQVIFLEGVEDFDVTRNGDVLLVQVRHTAKPISLGSKKALAALENYWSSAQKGGSREVSYLYHTTSAAAFEAKRPFGDDKGLELWRIAQTSPDVAARIAEYLRGKLKRSSQLRKFLETASPEEVRDRLIRPFTWLPDQPSIDQVRSSVDDRLVAILNAKNRPLTLVDTVRNHLAAHVWEQIRQKHAGARMLSYGDLLLQIDSAHTVLLRLPVEKIQAMVLHQEPGLALLNTFRQMVPKPPSPLLQRTVLTQQIERQLAGRAAVLLVGTVFKGKTTLVQQVAEKLCPDAWWFQVTGWTVAQLNNVLGALATEIEQGRCPAVVVIDDLDPSPQSLRTYQNTLGMVLYRAHAAGRAVLMTSAGLQANVRIELPGMDVAVVEVPELSTTEVRDLCIEHGCSQNDASAWAAIIASGTGGHPKLVQIRIAEVANRNWPPWSPSDFIEQSPGSRTAQDVARQLLRGTVPDPVADFLYTTSMASVSLRRATLISLAESAGIANPGDVVDEMSGRWLECIEGAWYRTTALLKGTSSHVWSPQKERGAHTRLHDAILEGSPMSPNEAAALVFHAYLAKDPQRLSRTCVEMLTLKGDEERREVYRSLLWLPYVSLAPGDEITSSPAASVWVRALQFRAAATLDMSAQATICDRWAEDIDRVEHEDLQERLRTVRWEAISVDQNPQFPLRFRLDACYGLHRQTQADGDLRDLINRVLESANEQREFPPDLTIGQFVLSGAAAFVRTAEALLELVTWLDKTATEELRHQFDACLEWPLVQSLGAFVHGVWVTAAAATSDWTAILAALGEVEEYAKRSRSVRFGREAAKARALILAEYLSRGEEAVTVIDQAERDYGTSAVLLEQRANLHFQEHHDREVLDVWRRLELAPDFNTVRNTYAYRRAAISAARLQEWATCEEYFQKARNSLLSEGRDLTDVALVVDTAMAATRGGRHRVAAKVLLDAIVGLPVEASTEGDIRWEAVLRAAVSVQGEVKDRVLRDGTNVFIGIPGDVSAPGYAASEAIPNQAARVEMTCAQVLELAYCLGVDVSGSEDLLQATLASRLPVVRYIAHQAQVAGLISQPVADGSLIHGLIAFDQNFDQFIAHVQTRPFLDPSDGGAPAKSEDAPERWTSLLLAAAICSGSQFNACAEAWEAEARRLGKNKLALGIAHLLAGFRKPRNQLDAVCRHDDNLLVRCGAALALLVDRPAPDRCFHLHLFLAQALVAFDGVPIQEMFNRHVADAFRQAWRQQAGNAFMFSTPRKTIPALLQGLDEGPGPTLSVMGVLRVAGAAVGIEARGLLDGLA